MLTLASHALAKHAQKLGCGVDRRRRGKVGGLCGLHGLRESLGLHGLHGLRGLRGLGGLLFIECTFGPPSFFRCCSIIYNFRGIIFSFRLNIFIFCRIILNILSFCSIILNILNFFNGYFLNIRHFI